MDHALSIPPFEESILDRDFPRVHVYGVCIPGASGIRFNNGILLGTQGRTHVAGRCRYSQKGMHIRLNQVTVEGADPNGAGAFRLSLRRDRSRGFLASYGSHRLPSHEDSYDSTCVRVTLSYFYRRKSEMGFVTRKVCTQVRIGA